MAKIRYMTVGLVVVRTMARLAPTGVMMGTALAAMAALAGGMVGGTGFGPQGVELVYGGRGVSSGKVTVTFTAD